MTPKEKISDDVIEPTLQFVVLCDGVSQPDQRGKVSFIGVFDKFLRPAIIPHFSIALGWKKGRGDHKFQIKILSPNLDPLLETPEMEIRLKHETESFRADLSIDGMNFGSPGVYWVEIFLNNQTVQSIPLPVEEEKK